MSMSVTSWSALVTIVAIGFGVMNCAIAQVTTDNTLPNNTSVTKNGNTFNITGGTQAGRNLFHSFNEFSVPIDSVASFNNAVDIQNIFSRVTGGSVSNIDGLIRANGTANLFLINPHGIIFGKNARLDIGGSFLASTANSIRFADGTKFSTANSPPPLLTNSVPIGLGFLEIPAHIVNQSQAANLDSSPSFDPQFPVPPTVGLQVMPGKTIALVGGDVVLEGGQLTAPGGRIELGSVDDGLMSLTLEGTSLALGYENIASFRNIDLSAAASADVSDYSSGLSSGSIHVFGQRITLSGGSRLASFNFGGQPGGSIKVTASDSVELIGTGTEDYIEDFQKLTIREGLIANFRNGLFTISPGAGEAGDIIINTPSFTARNGAFVQTSTGGANQGGNLTVNSDSVKVITSALLTGTAPGSTGNSGNLTINTQNLVAQDNGLVATSSLGQGQAGNLLINANQSVELIGNTPIPLANNIFIFTGLASSTLGKGNAGLLQINTGRLYIQDEAVIVSNTLGQGQGADIIVNARDSVELIGKSTSSQRGSGISTRTDTSSRAGDLTITTKNLIIENSGIEVSSFSFGNAGNLKVIANYMRLNNQGFVTARSLQSGNGGNIDLQVQDLLLLRNNSQISTTASGFGNGGNIDINTKFLVAVLNENSDITANTFTGMGGKVQITAQGIFGLIPRKREDIETLLATNDPAQLDPSRLPTSDITAISQTNPNFSGTIEVNIPDIDPSSSFVNLPTVPVDTEIVQSCSAGGTIAKSQFSITGRGGLPPNPSEALNTDAVQVDLVTINPKVDQRSEATVPMNVINFKPTPIVEAQGWVIDSRGNVLLTANPPKPTPQTSWYKTASCKLLQTNPS